MLPKAHRLKKKKDFDLVFEKGRSVKSGLLWCKVSNGSMDNSRIGFVVSKKVSLKAVVRNKVRRWLQNASAPLMTSLSRPFDIIVVALPQVQEKDFDEVKDMVAKIFTKLV